MGWKISWVWALSTVLSFALAAPVWAGSPEFAKRGTMVTWKWSGKSSDGKRSSGSNTVQVVGSRGEVGKFKKQGESKTHSFIPACWVCASSSYTYDKKAYAKLWPLEPGKSVKVALKSKSGRKFVSTFTVGKLQKVRLGFGAVEAYKITEEMRGTDGSKYRSVHTSYWAPSVGWNVKYDRKSSSGSRYKGEVIAIK
jgi:hypothetical protein